MSLLYNGLKAFTTYEAWIFIDFSANRGYYKSKEGEFCEKSI